VNATCRPLYLAFDSGVHRSNYTSSAAVSRAASPVAVKYQSKKNIQLKG